jgi:hypothetical protein
LDNISRSDNEERDDSCGKLDGIIEIRAQTSHSSEEQGHCEIAAYNDNIECEEGTCVTDKPTHKVYDNREYHDLNCRKGDINKNLGNPQSRRSMESVLSDELAN